MKTISTLLPAIFLAAVSLPAEVLLNQPLDFTDGRASTITSATSGFKTWDNFTLAESALIHRITFIGAFIDTVTSANNPVSPSGDNWNFQLATDDAGNPGSVTATESLPFNSVQQLFLGSGTISSQPVHVYRFTADLITPLFVTGGEITWLSTFSSAATLTPRFAWLSGSGGDGVAKQIVLSSGSISTYTDRAFRLDGDTVPEPGSLLLISAGGLLIALLRRRY